MGVDIYSPPPLKLMAKILSAPSPREMQTTAQQIFRSIQSEMAAVEEEFERQARSNIQIVAHIGQYLHQTGGKRVRPALLILSAKISAKRLTPRSSRWRR